MCLGDGAARQPLHTVRGGAAHGRQRLEAEQIRDQPLYAAGLLVEDFGGPSVKPYQPEGYWAQLNFPLRRWRADEGEGLHRRSLYTFWCRTFTHPAMLAFDAPSRERCTSERARSNTPLAALALLNDPIHVEAARVLAERVLTDAGTSAEDRMTALWERVLQRAPSDSELTVAFALVSLRAVSRPAAPMMRDKRTWLRLGAASLANGCLSFCAG